MGFQALGTTENWPRGNSELPLVVAAAGNDSTNLAFWPAAFPWVVGVGSPDANGKKSDYSNYGRWVDV